MAAGWGDCHSQSSCPVQGIMLVYDITNEKSFDNIRNWIRNIEEVRPPCTPLPVRRQGTG